MEVGTAIVLALVFVGLCVRLRGLTAPGVELSTRRRSAVYQLHNAQIESNPGEKMHVPEILVRISAQMLPVIYGNVTQAVLPIILAPWKRSSGRIPARGGRAVELARGL